MSFGHRQDIAQSVKQCTTDAKVVSSSLIPVLSLIVRYENEVVAPKMCWFFEDDMNFCIGKLLKDLGVI